MAVWRHWQSRRLSRVYVRGRWWLAYSYGRHHSSLKKVSEFTQSICKEPRICSAAVAAEEVRSSFPVRRSAAIRHVVIAEDAPYNPYMG